MKVTRSLVSRITNAPKNVERIKSLMRMVGYEPMHWTRVVPYQECVKVLRDMRPETLDVLEVSAGKYWQTHGFNSFTDMNYPEYDICNDVLDRQFDLIIADNVFEHLLFPYRAAKNVLAMLKPGGTFMTLTPFLIRYHPIPIDCSRWTELGLRNLLIETGFDENQIETGSWGNRACVVANFKKWARRGWFGSLKNEPNFPVTVWAFAKKPVSGSPGASA